MQIDLRKILILFFLMFCYLYSFSKSEFNKLNNSETDQTAIDNFVGFYTLEDDEESLKRKNILTKNSFLAYDNLLIKNFLIFKDSNQLFLVELRDKNNNSAYLNEIKKFVDDKTKIQSFKNRFLTPEHNWVYYSFLKNDGLYKYKRGLIFPDFYLY